MVTGMAYSRLINANEFKAYSLKRRSPLEIICCFESKRPFYRTSKDSGVEAESFPPIRNRDERKKKSKKDSRQVVEEKRIKNSMPEARELSY